MTNAGRRALSRLDGFSLAVDARLGRLACGALSGPEAFALICDRPLGHRGPHRDRYQSGVSPFSGPGMSETEP